MGKCLHRNSSDKNFLNLILRITPLLHDSKVSLLSIDSYCNEYPLEKKTSVALRVNVLGGIGEKIQFGIIGYFITTDVHGVSGGIIMPIKETIDMT